MARISIEESWFSDPRREYLRRKIGDAADFAALMLWRTAQTYWSKERGMIPRRVFNVLAYAEELLASGLAEAREDYVYACGSADHLEWAAKQQDGRAAGGRARASAPRGANGAFLPASHQQTTSIPPAGGPASPAAPAPAPAPVLVSEVDLPDGLNLAPPSDADPPRSPRGIPLETIEREVYQHYPRKAGKSEGLKAARRELRSAEDLLAMAAAVKNFRAQMQREARAEDVIPYFSTWVRKQWRDWISPEKSESFAVEGAARGTKPPDPAVLEAEKVAEACAKWGSHRDDVAAMKAHLGPELYGVACRAGLYRIRELKRDGFRAKRVAEMLAHARAQGPPPGQADGFSNREATRTLAQLGLFQEGK